MSDHRKPTDLLGRVAALEAELADVEARLADPEVFGEQRRYQELARRHKQLEPIVACGRDLRTRAEDADTLRELLPDAGDEREVVRADLAAADADTERLTEQLRLLLLPRDPNDDRNVIVEIRGAEGGEEANLFARDLYEMYRTFAADEGWTSEVLDAQPSDLGGYSDITFLLKGDGVWTRMHQEAGPHRVQRVPVTESQGRVHTSSATVTVLPEAEEVDVDIDPNDLDIDVYRSSGPGGQSVNTTDSAVRITHLPTGLVVSMQDEKSQIQNRAAAMRVLQSRLLVLRQQEEDAKKKELAGDIKASWGDQMRSYVLHPYQMVKDLRTEYEVGNPQAVLDGDIDGFLEAGIRWRKQREK